jgi:hypothetical protein
MNNNLLAARTHLLFRIEDFGIYLSAILEARARYMLLLALRGPVTLDLEIERLLARMGIRHDFNRDEPRYCAVYDSGTVRAYRGENTGALVTHHERVDQTAITLLNGKAGGAERVKIVIDGKNYAPGSAGLNIVVYDKKGETVVDAFVYDGRNIIR